MFTPKLFACDDLPTLHALIKAHSFGTLIVTLADGSREITHLPFLIDTDAGPLGTLRCHVARANPIAKAAASGAAMTAVFMGPHTYVSPRWYETPASQVPTWNYAAAHCHGTSSGVMTPDDLLTLLRDLSASLEGAHASAWSPEVLPPAFVEALLQQIVGFAIPIAKIDGKTKLSQNRSATDHGRVVEHMLERGAPDDLEMATLMKRDPRRPTG